MNVPYWLNTGWMWRCRREANAFAQATRSVGRSQHAVLRSIVANNRDTAFGRRHRFTSVQSPADWRRLVPLSNYDDYQTAVAEIAAGQPRVLTEEAVELLEPTSGSTSGEKLIPYTSALRQQFQRAVAVWIADTFRHQPAVRRGRAYWSISPALAPARTTGGGVRIGFDDDAAYLGRLERGLLRHLLVMPSEVSRLTSIEDFRYCTLLHLLSAPDLALISVWSPTFLTSLLSGLEPWTERLAEDLVRGRATLPRGREAGLCRRVRKLRCSAARARYVADVLRSTDSTAANLNRLWPHLALISCWADAAAGDFVADLQAVFPGVRLQPKGLVATEACVSFPLTGCPGAALAIRSHFFEFLDVERPPTSAESRLANELQVGGRYEVVVTTGGGLYRYRLGDLVDVVGLRNRCPLVRFVGRRDRRSDLVGEKLDERHVAETLRKVARGHRLEARFAIVVPRSAPAGYHCYLEVGGPLQSPAPAPAPALVAAVRDDLERGLHENPHYRYAVQLGQLQPLRLTMVSESRPGLWATYEAAMIKRGLRMGEIKPTALDAWPGWISTFDDAVASTKAVSAPAEE